MGVFYGAAAAEARAMTGEHVVVVGAGNSAGQAALHLARFAARVNGGGDDRLETIVVEDARTGRREDLHAPAMFVLIGAEPHTDWLRDTLQRDRAGFVATGRDLSVDRWPMERPPMLLETSVPGVFAVGDVRQGSVKRVAAAAGEGSVVIGSVHQHLAEVAARVASRT